MVQLVWLYPNVIIHLPAPLNYQFTILYLDCLRFTKSTHVWKHKNAVLMSSSNPCQKRGFPKYETIYLKTNKRWGTELLFSPPSFVSQLFNFPFQEAAQRREQKKIEKKQMKMKQIKVKAMWNTTERGTRAHSSARFGFLQLLPPRLRLQADILCLWVCQA